jgi:hypothetical protein
VLLSLRLRAALRSAVPSERESALATHRRAILSHVAHLRPLLRAAAPGLCSRNDRLVSALHSRLGAALHTAATDAQTAHALAQYEESASDGDGADMQPPLRPQHPSTDAERVCGGYPWAWEGGKPSAAVTRARAEAVAHEQRCLSILQVWPLILLVLSAAMQRHSLGGATDCLRCRRDFMGALGMI